MVFKVSLRRRLEEAKLRHELRRAKRGREQGIKTRFETAQERETGQTRKKQARKACVHRATAWPQMAQKEKAGICSFH